MPSSLDPTTALDLTSPVWRRYNAESTMGRFGRRPLQISGVSIAHPCDSESIAFYIGKHWET